MKKCLILMLISCTGVCICSSCRFMRMPDKKAGRLFYVQHLKSSFNDIYVGRIRLHYIKAGMDTLPTLFFIHGSPGSWKAYKRYLMDTLLLSRFRMIAIDRPGYGFSDHGHASDLKKQEGMIHEIVNKEQNGKPFHLIGHSLGGPILIKMAQQHPKDYSSLTILAGSISPFDEPKEKWRSLFVGNPLQYLLPGPFRVCNTEIWYFKKELFELDSSYDLLTMPVTFIHGDRDQLVTVHNVTYGREKLSFNAHVKVIIIAGAGHHIPWEHYEIIRDHLLTLAPINHALN